MKKVCKQLNSFYYNELTKEKNKLISALTKLIENDYYLKNIYKFITLVIDNLQALKIN